MSDPQVTDAVKEEPMDQQATELYTARKTPSAAEQQLGNSAAPSSMDHDVQMASAEDEDDEAETCTTENNILIKNSLSKCVICSKSFVPDDNPKLLECLHAACVGCVKSQSQPSDNDLQSMIFL